MNFLEIIGTFLFCHLAVECREGQLSCSADVFSCDSVAEAESTSGHVLFRNSLSKHSGKKSFKEDGNDDTVLDFCDQGKLSRMRGADPTSDAKKEVENQILSDIAEELSTNNVDRMAKDIFSFYICVRWVPDTTFWHVAEQELANEILDSVVEQGINTTQAIGELYQTFKFVPLLCSRNLEVYEKKSPETHTFYRRFEEDVSAVATWLRESEKKPVWQRLRKADEAFCNSTQMSMNSRSCNLAMATKELANQVNDFFGGKLHIDFETRDDRWKVMESIFKSFVREKDMTWNDDLTAWKEKFPYYSFVGKPDGVKSSYSPISTERFMVCFGKRVASEMHRRPTGKHIMTDQNSVGCHGWWRARDVAGMLTRTVDLWKPPTCKLAEMAYTMKKQILDMYTSMNEDLYDALPSMMQDEYSFKDEAPDATAPLPFRIETLEKNGKKLYAGMRVAAVKGFGFKKAECWTSFAKCNIKIEPGAGGNLLIQGGNITVRWDDDPDKVERMIDVEDIQVVPQEYMTTRHGMADTVSSSARWVEGGVRDLVGTVWNKQYTGLAYMMSGSITKWVVCPLSSGVNYTALDMELGTEDAALRQQVVDAYSKWTGSKTKLPGEICKRDKSILADSMGCQVCDFSELHSDHPEQYILDNGSPEQFVCPLVPPLDAVQQLEIFMEKEDMCLLHMTENQLREYRWQYNGHFPARRQNNRTENLPNTEEYELAKILGVSKSVGPKQVSFGRTCSPRWKADYPRFCNAPELQSKWTSVSEMAGFVGNWLGGSLGMPVDAIRHLIGNTQRTLAENLTAGSAAHLATLVGEQTWDSLMGLGRFVRSGASSATAEVAYALEGSKERHARMQDELFGSGDGGAFLHSVSFQSEIGSNGATSKSRERYRRFGVVCPCTGYDPALELALRRQWSEVALRVVHEAVRYTPEILELSSPSVHVRAEARLFWKGNEAIGNKTYYDYGATVFSNISSSLECQMRTQFGIEACVPPEECQFEEGTWLSRNRACVAKKGVVKAKLDWQPVWDLNLASTLGGNPFGQVELSTLKALTVQFHCGPKSAFGRSGGPRTPTHSIKKCMEEGVQKNAEMKAHQPWKVYFPDEVVVMAIFGTLDEPKCLSHDPHNIAATKMVCAGAVPTLGLDDHLRDSEKGEGANVTYWGLRAGSGFPPGTVKEVVLRPEDALRVTGRLLK